MYQLYLVCNHNFARNCQDFLLDKVRNGASGGAKGALRGPFGARWGHAGDDAKRMKERKSALEMVHIEQDHWQSSELYERRELLIWQWFCEVVND